MMRPHELFTASAGAGAGVFLLDAWSAIAGATGPIVDVLKLVMVVVIVGTSTVGALGSDSDGDGVPDFISNLRRLRRALRNAPAEPSADRTAATDAQEPESPDE